MRYAPDTNFLLHFQSLSEIPWQEITSDATIEIVLLDEVLRELDNHKHDGNGRRARKARRIVEIIRPLVSGESDQVHMRDRGLSVTLVLAPHLDPLREKPSDLDYSKPDARIAEEALACAREFEDSDFTLIGDDTIATRLARKIGLRSILAPESWRLAPEPDERDRLISSLRSQVSQLQNLCPSIELAILQDDREVDVVRGSFPYYPDLTDECVEEFMGALISKFPVDDGTELGTVAVILHKDRDSYQQARLLWEQHIRERIRRAALILNAKVNPISLSLRIRNSGSSSAEHLIVDISSAGEFGLVEERAHTEQASKLGFGFKQPPTMRQFVMGRIYSVPDMYSHDLARYGLNSIIDVVAPRALAGREMVWVFDKPRSFSEHCQGECSELRHGIGEEEFSFHVRAPVDAERTVVGGVTVRYSAKNLSEAVSRTWRVELTGVEQDTVDAVSRNLEVELGINFNGSLSASP
ncbi:PIN domain-containing protein [Pseudoxanthomonas sp. CCNWLW206]